jgi:hypothetical protein
MYAYATLATLGDDVYFEPSTALVSSDALPENNL